MNIRIIITLVVAAMTMAACGNSSESKPDEKKGHTNAELLLKGDETIYGLACEGTGDSVVVLLPSNGSDPVTYNCLTARRRGKVVGTIKTGDWIGVVLNKRNKKVADFVVDLDQLKGIWCYIVMPKMRDYATMSKKMQQRMMNEMSDLLKETFLIPREYGFWVKRQWQAQSVGYIQEASSLADESPVVYPPLGYFTGWHIWNGKFVITSGTPVFKKDGTPSVTNLRNDTCNIDYLDEDSLVLSSDGISRSYYKKTDINDVNVKAKAIAAMRSKAALKETTE